MVSFERIDPNNQKRKISLLKRIGGGGAADIFKIKEFPDEVAKIYKNQHELASYEQKVNIMLKNKPDLPDFIDPKSKKNYPLAAWPKALIKKGSFKGFSMPKISLTESTTMQRILQSSMRRKTGLNETLLYRLAVARNLCALVAKLNQKHYYLIDLKPLNLQVYKTNGNIVLLDCDGISIMEKSSGFSGSQVTTEYTPAENFGKKAEDFDENRCQKQERFALAVIIFQLLNNGLHPFTFKANDTKYAQGGIVENIKSKRYAYDGKQHIWGVPNPQSILLSFTDEMISMFNAAFTTSSRPSADQWFSELDKFVSSKNKNHFRCKNNENHFDFGKGCGECNKSLNAPVLLRSIGAPNSSNQDILLSSIIKKRTPSFILTLVALVVGSLLILGSNP